MSRSQESYNKKEVKDKKEKKRKEKDLKRQARKSEKQSMDDMIAYVDENGMISSTPPDPLKKTEIKLEDIRIATPKNEDLVEEISERRGTVTFFNHSKGFGFLRDNQTKESIFFHVNELKEEISEGNLVSYQPGRSHKGPIALQVMIIRDDQSK